MGVFGYVEADTITSGYAICRPPPAKITLPSTCFKPGWEFGTKEAGVCEWAHTLAIICDGECLAAMRQHAWTKGVTMTERHITSAEECQNVCEEAHHAHNGCDYFVFDQRVQGGSQNADHTTCYMKRTLTCSNNKVYGYVGSDTQRNVTSGPFHCEEGGGGAKVKWSAFDGILVELCFWPGYEYGSINSGACAGAETIGAPIVVRSAEECQEKCANDIVCEFFVYDVSKKCSLKHRIESCDEPFGMKQESISGPKRCPPPKTTTRFTTTTTTTTATAPPEEKAEICSTNGHCYNKNCEYGNKDLGACGWAHLVHIACGHGCVDILQKSEAEYLKNTDKSVLEDVSLESCQQKCDTIAACQVFTLQDDWYGHRTCWFKKQLSCNGDSSAWKPKDGRISGPTNGAACSE